MSTITKAKSDLELMCFEDYKRITGRKVYPSDWFTSAEWRDIAKAYIKIFLSLKLAAMKEAAK
jgi:hypothetical protein